MTPKPDLNSRQSTLRSAQPRLICRVEPSWRLNDAQDQGYELDALYQRD